MPTIINNKFSEEIHPWGWHIPSGATILLIGTFPTDLRNRKLDFFYCSSTNRFWQILSAVIDQPVELLNGKDAINERLRILDKLRLGLTDMGKKVYRQQGSSKDHSLFPVEFIDIVEILSEHPSIRSLIVSGNNQGNSSLNWFSIFCSLNDIRLDVRQLKNKGWTEIVVDERRVRILLSFSPSRLSRITTESLIDSYRCLFKEVL